MSSNLTINDYISFKQALKSISKMVSKVLNSFYKINYY